EFNGQFFGGKKKFLECFWNFLGNFPKGAFLLSKKFVFPKMFKKRGKTSNLKSSSSLRENDQEITQIDNEQIKTETVTEFPLKENDKPKEGSKVNKPVINL